MKATKQADKIPGPLFPRLHVNDTDKRGPRAPPRNKMALYEQFSVPSNRFNSTSFMLPLHHNSSNLVPSNSSSQDCGNEKNVFSQPERVTSRSSDGMQHNATRVESEQRSLKPGNSRTSVGARSVIGCTSLCENNSNAKHSCEKIDDVDDFTVPTFDQPGNVLSSKQDAPVIVPVKPTPSHANNPRKGSTASYYSSQCPTSNDNSLKQINTSDGKVGVSVRPYNGKRSEESLEFEIPREKSASHNVAAKTSTASVDKDLISDKLFVDTLHQGSFHHGDPTRVRNLDDNPDLQKDDFSNIRNKESSSRIRRSSNLSLNSKEDDPKENRSTHVERNNEKSEALVVDIMAGFEISPEDIVGVIGPKQFWKARRAIVNQQRVFSIQVFELHRLITVQKLIAASPHLLLEGDPYLCKSPEKPSITIPLTESNKCSQIQVDKGKNISDKYDQNSQAATENAAGCLPVLSSHNEADKGLQLSAQSVVPSENAPNRLAVPDNRKNPCCFQPPANQWLVPVMSPSEGLVYKPYAGPCPPPGGFMAPMYGSCTPLGVAPVPGNYMNPAFDVPATHQPPSMGIFPNSSAISPNYFSTPYGLPAMNPLISTSAIEQSSNLAGSWHYRQFDQHSRSSCNLSRPRSEAFSGCLWNMQASKDSELQGSTASSPSKNAPQKSKDVLPLFPIDPMTNNLSHPSGSVGKDNQSRIIKVVPHNPRSASESAARIFRSIQEGRQQHES